MCRIRFWIFNLLVCVPFLLTAAGAVFNRSPWGNIWYVYPSMVPQDFRLNGQPIRSQWMLELSLSRFGFRIRDDSFSVYSSFPGSPVPPGFHSGSDMALLYRKLSSAKASNGMVMGVGAYKLNISIWYL